MVHGDMRCVAKAKIQFPCECGIKFHAMQTCAAWREQICDCAVTWPNLDDGSLARVTERFRDAETRGFIYKKVLTELGLFGWH